MSAGPGASVDAAGPSTRPSEMNDTSNVMRLTGSGGVRRQGRAFVRSMDTTRGSWRNDPRAGRARHRGRRRGRRALEDVGEAAGRRTHVEARGRSGRSRTHRGRRQACGRHARRTAPARRGPPASPDRRDRRACDRASRVPLADADLAGEHECLRTGARLDQAALDEELVESDAGPFGRRRAHPAIVAQRPSPRLDSQPRLPMVERCVCTHGRNGHRTIFCWSIWPSHAPTCQRTTRFGADPGVRWRYVHPGHEAAHAERRPRRSAATASERPGSSPERGQ